MRWKHNFLILRSKLIILLWRRKANRSQCFSCLSYLKVKNHNHFRVWPTLQIETSKFLLGEVTLNADIINIYPGLSLLPDCNSVSMHYVRITHCIYTFECKNSELKNKQISNSTLMSQFWMVYSHPLVVSSCWLFLTCVLILAFRLMQCMIFKVTWPVWCVSSSCWLLCLRNGSRVLRSMGCPGSLWWLQLWWEFSLCSCSCGGPFSL